MRLEQHAAGSTIPGDVAVRLSGPGSSWTFYNLTVVNCLTDEVIKRASQRKVPAEELQRVLSDAFARKVAKHGT